MLHYINKTKIPTSANDWSEWTEDDQVSFVHLSQQMEAIGLLLAERLISIDLLDKTLGSFISSTWEKCRPLILDLRENHQDPFLSEYFQWMAEQIERRMKEKPRKPFFRSAQTEI